MIRFYGAFNNYFDEDEVGRSSKNCIFSMYKKREGHNYLCPSIF